METKIEEKPKSLFEEPVNLKITGDSTLKIGEEPVTISLQNCEVKSLIVNTTRPITV